MSSDKVTVREATRKDLDGIVRLWREMMDWHAGLDPRIELAPDAEKVWRRWAARHVSSDDSRLLVAEAAGELVGMCMGSERELPALFTETRLGFISDLVVAAAHRRRGLGTRLAREMAAWLKSRGFRRIELNVAAANPAAEGFWRSLGAVDHHRVMWIEP